MELQYIFEATAMMALSLMLFGGVVVLNFGVVIAGAATVILCGFALEWPRPQGLTALEGGAILICTFVTLVAVHALAKSLSITVWQRVRGRAFDSLAEPWEPFIAVLPVKTEEGWRWLEVLERRRDGHGSSSETADSWWVYRDLA